MFPADVFPRAVFPGAIFPDGIEVPEVSIFNEYLTGSIGGGSKPQTVFTFPETAFNIVVQMSPVIDITGWTFKVVARRSQGATPIVNKTTGFEIVDAENGVFRIVFHANETPASDVPPGEYRLTIWRQDTDEEYVLAWALWTIEFD